MTDIAPIQGKKQRETVKWGVLSLLVLIAITVFAVLLVDTPKHPLESDSRRDLSTPSRRLCGRWRAAGSGLDVTFVLADQELKLGACVIRGTKPLASRFKVLSENTSGTEVILRLFWVCQLGISGPSDAKCSVTKDGRSLSMELADTLLMLDFIDTAVRLDDLEFALTK